jgi:hypothetical protein
MPWIGSVTPNARPIAATTTIEMASTATARTRAAEDLSRGYSLSRRPWNQRCIAWPLLSNRRGCTGAAPANEGFCAAGGKSGGLGPTKRWNVAGAREFKSDGIGVISNFGNGNDA